MKLLDKPTVHDIFLRFYPGYLEKYSPSPVQSKVANCIINCKTGAYGANISICEDCGHTQIHYNSCRNRCCPTEPIGWLQCTACPCNAYSTPWSSPPEIPPGKSSAKNPDSKSKDRQGRNSDTEGSAPPRRKASCGDAPPPPGRDRRSGQKFQNPKAVGPRYSDVRAWRASAAWSSSQTTSGDTG